MAAIRTKQRERDEQAARVEHAEGQGQSLPDLAGWLTVVWSCHEGLPEVLQAGGADGRRVLKALPRGPIKVEEIYEHGVFQGWRYEGQAELGRILEGVVRKPAGAGVTCTQCPWVGRG